MTPSVLWVTPRADPAQRAGGDIRTIQLIKALSENLPVDVLVVGDPEVDSSRLQQVTGCRSARWLPGQAGVRARLLAIRHGWPLAVARSWSAEAQRVVEGRPHDVLVADFIQSALYAPERPHVLDLHNAEAARVAELPAPPQLMRRIEHGWDRRAMRRWESRAVRAPQAHVVVVSDQDADALGVPAAVVANGTGLQPLRAAPADGTLLFVGSLDYPPNLEAVRWWAEAVWPHVESGRKLTVVGRGGAAALGRLAGHPALHVVGEVADLIPHLSAASLAVVPLRHGGGSRLKVLEALAWSIPVLSTSKGVEGLGLAAGSEVVIADEPAGLARAVDQLMSDHHRRTATAAAGRAAAERFSWPVVAERLLEVIYATHSELERVHPR